MNCPKHKLKWEWHWIESKQLNVYVCPKLNCGEMWVL